MNHSAIVPDCGHGAGPSSQITLTRENTETLSVGQAAVLGKRTPEHLRDLAVLIASAAAAHVREARRRITGPDGRVPVAATKSSEVDPVTEIDRSSEQLIRGLLATYAPQDAVLGEENGGHLVPDTVTWVVDPVDGTVNFVYGIPASAVSVAATVHGSPVAGAVADISRRRVYSACLGGAATVGDEENSDQDRILGQLTGPTDLAHALIGTGFSYDADRRALQASLLAGLLPRIRDIRRMGSAALDLCGVAAGMLDGYYEHGLGPWDHAAGVLVAARSGAVVQMPRLTSGYSDGVGVLAAAPGIAEELAGHTSTVAMPARG